MNEGKRLEALYRYRILDTFPEQTFDDIVAMAADACGMPIASIAFVDKDRMWVKASYGRDAMSVGKEISFADYVLRQGQTTVITNVLENEVFKNHPLVLAGPKARFFAGTPLITPSGFHVGTICLMDCVPCDFSGSQVRALERIARHTIEILEARLAREVEKSQHEAVVESQTEFLNAVLENLADGIVACDGEGRLTIFNKATREFHGLNSDANIPQSEWANHYSLYDADGVTVLEHEKIPLVRAFLGEVLKNVEMVVAPHVGPARELVCTGRAIFDKNGKKLGAVMSMTDVTEKKRALARVEANGKTFKTLIDACPVGIAIVNNDGKISLWNPGAEAIFGWTAAEAIGNEMPYLRPGQLETSRGFTDFVRRTQQKIDIEIERHRKDGRLANLRLLITPHYNDLNSFDGFILIYTDITDLKQREKNLLDTNRALKEASVAKSEFLANMSHEIRTPLNGVIGMTELTLMTDLKHEQREQLEIVQTSANNLLTIISDILDFSKIEAGKLDIDKESFNLVEVLKDVRQTLELSAVRKGLQLLCELPPAESLVFMGDAGRVRQVLTNLINNAIKFTREGEVRISVQMQTSAEGQRRVRVSVQDTGDGISPETLEKLFQPFSQADSSTTKKFGGTGLGLSISKRLVELMNGEIGVRSSIGAGSTFYFELPVEVSSAKPPMTSTPIASGPLEPLDHLRVLLAEDNLVNQTIAKKMLKQLGIAAVVVGDGQAAVEALQKDTYDVILMDCQMPVMDGFEATRQIRAAQDPAQRDVVIVALTANAMKGDRERCLDAGMTDYLSKPVRLNDLRAMLSRQLKKAA